MTRRARRTFDRQFKHNALRMILDEGIPLEEVARNLDVNRTVLHRWKQDFKSNPDDAFPGHGGRRNGLEEENRRLKQDLNNAEEERDILKKALAIFSQPKKIASGS